ncbi:uncharacterized protein METZ01_LOCUS455798, partial [marine metagenome]
NLTFVWDYSYADAGTGGSALANFNENGADNSFYGHVQNGGPALNDNGWQDIAYDLAEGDHTFKITATDPYDESASSSTTIKVRREHDAPAAGVVVDHEDLKYTIVTVSEGILGAQGADDCYGDVYDGDLDNTKTIELSNEENIIETYRKQEDGSWVADDITAGEDAPLVQIDKSLAAETTYTYSVQSYNSDHATGLSDEGSSADATTGNRPTVEVLTPDGAEIRSIGDLYDVYFTTTDPSYISEIEVFYLHDD